MPVPSHAAPTGHANGQVPDRPAAATDPAGAS
jgi:hypothetical protein